MQGAYRCFVQNSKFMTTSSAAHIHFLGACVIELYGHDSMLAYQHAFSHLSELAQLSRRALDTRTAAACQQVRLNVHVEWGISHVMVHARWPRSLTPLWLCRSRSVLHVARLFV